MGNVGSLTSASSFRGSDGVRLRRESRRILFFAVLPDGPARESIGPLVASSQDRWGLSGPARPEHVWHATMQGIGPDEPTFRDLAMYVGHRISMEAFDVAVDEVMSFPGSNAFVLTGAGAGVAPLHELHNRLKAEVVSQFEFVASRFL